MSVPHRLNKIVAVLSLAVASMAAHADLTITVTENTSLGGTDWSFSGGSGVYSVSPGFNSPIFFVGDSSSNPMAFDANSPHCQCGGITVLAGTNVFGFQNIFSGAYTGIPGNNGVIPHALDFQTFTDVGPTVNMASLNGLVLNLAGMSFTSYVPGTYTLDNYYTGYGTNFGIVTLVVGVPEPEVYAMLMAGLGLLGATARRRKTGLAS